MREPKKRQGSVLKETGSRTRKRGRDAVNLSADWHRLESLAGETQLIYIYIYIQNGNGALRRDGSGCATCQAARAPRDTATESWERGCY